MAVMDSMALMRPSPRPRLARPVSPGEPDASSAVCLADDVCVPRQDWAAFSLQGEASAVPQASEELVVPRANRGSSAAHREVPVGQRVAPAALAQAVRMASRVSTAKLVHPYT